MSKSKLFTYESINTNSKQILTNNKMIPNIADIMATNCSMNLMVLVYEHWTSSYHRVTQIEYNSKSGNITLTLDTCPTQKVGDAASGNRFYLLNNMELLTMDNQFYYNESSMELSVLTKATITDEMSVLLPQDIEILTIKGTSANAKVERMRFEGLTLKFSKIDFSVALGGTDQSAAFLKTATVHTINVADVIFDGVNVTDTGGYAVWFDQGSYNCAMMTGMISDLGAGGIRIGANQGMSYMLYLP